MAQGGAGSANAILNWQFVRTIGYAAELEEASGEPELASRARRKAAELARAIEAHFWDAERGLFADDLGKTAYSEHAQAEAILSGFLSADKADSIAAHPVRGGGTVPHHDFLFALSLRGLSQAGPRRCPASAPRPLARSSPARALHDPGGPRAHALRLPRPGAHPLYHFFATILGIRPASAGFRTVRIEPQLGSLTFARGQCRIPGERSRWNWRFTMAWRMAA